MAVLAQRLVRVVCTHCKESAGYRMTPEGDNIETFRGHGCERCFGTGYTGRIGIFEMMELDDEIRKMIMAKADATEITSAARRNGMRNLREDGWLKVRRRSHLCRRSDARRPGVRLVDRAPVPTNARVPVPTNHLALQPTRNRALQPTDDRVVLPSRDPEDRCPRNRYSTPRATASEFGGMTTYFFKAVASDGKLRTGTFHADSDRWVATELRKQGLTPVYVGSSQRSLRNQAALVRQRPTPRRPLLHARAFDLLNAGVPLDRAL